jgi:hypothetical protein
MKVENYIPVIRNSSFIKLWFLLAPFLLIQCRPSQNELSEEVFANPAVEYRPMALWTWMNGYVDTTRLVYELEQMKEKGMRGALIWDIGALSDPEGLIPAGPAFLGDESLEYIQMALKTSKELGLNLGMSVASSWNAGGEWVDTSDAIMQLLNTRVIIEGPSNMPVEIGVPASNRGPAEAYSLITSIAVPWSENKTIDYSSVTPISLDNHTVDGKVIYWEVPEGKWEILSFFMCNTMQPIVVPSPNSNGLMIDHLSRKATENHFDHYFSRLGKITSPDLHLDFLFLDSYEVWPSTDWTPGFIEEFKSRNGYDPVPYLPLLKGYSGNDSILDNRFRGDYRRVVGDMMVENHFALTTEIANAHGVKAIAEGGHGGYPRVDPLKAMGHSDVPMGEFWNRQHYWVTKEASSAAHIYGKKVVASESLTGWMHWQHGPTDYKQLCDIAFCEGLNQIVFHTFSHNPEIAGKPGFVYHAGEHINVNATWWNMARPFMDYLGRCSYVLRQGNFVADVLLYYGDDVPNLVPPKRLDPNHTPDMPGLFPQWINDDSKCTHCGRPKPVNPGKLPGYDYDYVNDEIITTALRAEKGKLVLPHGQSYRVMMIPDRADISLEVLRSLEKLVFDGAVVLGPKPERSTSLKGYPDCDVEVKELAAKIWGNCDGKTVLSNQYGKGTVYWGKTMSEVLDELRIRPDFEVRGVDNCDRRIDYVHRQTGAEDIYFVSNSYETVQDFTAVFRVEGNRVPEIWDAETGLIQRAVEYKKTKEGITMELVMEPLASRFIVFRQKSTGTNDAGLPYDLQFGLRRTAPATGPVDLTANWEIRFDTIWGGPGSFRMDKLQSWTEAEDEGVKYYSGTATYTRGFTVAEDALAKGTEAYVVFEDIQEMARVSINGNDCGIVWLPPYKVNITRWLKPGENTISVQVVNTWNNRIVGDLTHPDGTQYTSTNAKTRRFRATSPLLKSGLMGKAEIVFTKKNEN